MNQKRIEYIDFAKGFAILSIVTFHYCQPYLTGVLSKAIMIGGTSVHLFFVLSGFGLELSSKVVSVLGFYKKRFSKILIPYYLIILIIFAIKLVFHIYENDGIYALGGHLFLYKMFDEKIIGSFGYHFWFVSTIIQFYVFFPVITYVKRKTSLMRFLMISFGISFTYWILLSVYHLSGQRVFNSFFLQYLWEFNLGMVLAHLYKIQKIKFWEQNGLILLGISILSLTIMTGLALKGGELGLTFNDIPASIGYVSLSALIYSLCRTRFKFLKKIIAFIGQFSYELYLVHMLVFILMNKFFLDITSLNSNIYFSLLFILPVSILISIIFMKLSRFFFALAAANLP